MTPQEEAEDRMLDKKINSYIKKKKSTGDKRKYREKVYKRRKKNPLHLFDLLNGHESEYHTIQ